LSGEAESDLERVGDDAAKKNGLKLYPKGAVLFAKSGMSATKDRIYVLKEPAYAVSHLAVLIPNPGVSAEYLRFALKAFPPSVLIKDTAYPSINRSDIQKHEIPVPEHADDQIRIARLLGKVEQLIARRRQHLQQLDEFVKSVFLDMFGEPACNEKAWAKEKIGSFTAVGTGATPSRKEMDRYYGGKIPWVKTTEVQNTEIFDTQECITEFALKETNCSLYPPRTVLLAMYGQGKTRGQVGMLKIAAATNQACAAIAPSEHNQTFIYEHLKLMYQQIRALGRGGNQENLNLSLVKNIELLLPPKKLQNKFAAIVGKTRTLKSRYRQSLKDLETLYAALSQRAFQGQLDLSRIA